MSLVIRDLAVTDAKGGRLLDGIDLDVPSGASLVVIGETGSGKSLLAEALLGLLAPGLHVDGSVRFDGEDPIPFGDWRRLRARWADRIAFVPQEPGRALDPTMPIGHQLETPRRMGASARDAALAAVDLPASIARFYPHTLSGGMAQRVLVAAAALDRAPLVVADEPTKALDAERVEQTLVLLRRLQSMGRQLVVVTHDHRVVRAVGGMAAVLAEGRLVEYGPAAALLEAPRAAYTRAWVGAEAGRWPACSKCGATTPLLLESRGLTFGHRRGEPLFAGLDLHLHGGQVLAVTGPSGVGKTTLGNLLIGLAKPQAGTIGWRDGILTAALRRQLRRRYQKLHQDPASVFLADRTLGRQLGDVASLVPACRMERRLPPLLERLKLRPALLGRFPGEVSGGEAQRLALCRLLLLEPWVIVADEPTSRLDPVVQRETMLLLRELVDEQALGLVLLTHDRAIVRAVADAVLDLPTPRSPN